MSGTAIPPRPVALPVQADELPPILCSLRRFVGWSYIRKPGNGNGKPGKWTKPPYVATDVPPVTAATPAGAQKLDDLPANQAVGSSLTYATDALIEKSKAS